MPMMVSGQGKLDFNGGRSTNLRSTNRCGGFFAVKFLMQQVISARNEQIDTFKGMEHDYTSLEATLQTLPHKLSHEIMV